MMRSGRTRLLAILATLAVGLTLVSADYAEARRGGSFGSRGTRTFQAPPATRTAPNQTAPVERSMSPATAPRQVAPAPGVGAQRPGLFGGLGGGLLGGLLAGGLLGMLMGYGFGGAAGMLGFVLQMIVVFVLARLAMAYFASRRSPATAAAGGAPGSATTPGVGPGTLNRQADAAPARAGGFTIPSIGGASAPQTRDIKLGQSDLDTFEQRLAEVQAAFAAEDHAELRRLSTPEMVSFFSEELAENAKRGLRNDVSDVRLVEADIAEAWVEGETEYATAAFRYESIDVMRDRDTGAVVEGGQYPEETVELWTFVRDRGGDWKLSAIQEA